jgi:hypothetical protein
VRGFLSKQFNLKSAPTDIPKLRQVRLGSMLLKKSEYRLGLIFSAPWARFSDADAGGLIIYIRLNGASFKPICGNSIVLMALHIGLHVGRWHEPNGVAKRLQLARPMMRRGAGFDTN